MDKFENDIRESLQTQAGLPLLDLEALLADTQRRISRRALLRKSFYTAPLLLILAMGIWGLLPSPASRQSLPGVDLFSTHFGEIWTDQLGINEEDIMNEKLFEASLDYLMDDQNYALTDDAGELLESEDDLEALYTFLKEV